MMGDSYHSPVALAHMSEVVASINVYDRLYGDPRKAMIHLNGLAKMITLTGGIGELAKRNIIIAEKVFRYVSVNRIQTWKQVEES